MIEKKRDFMRGPCWKEHVHPPLGCYLCKPENWTPEAIHERRLAAEERHKKHGDKSAPLTIQEFDDP